MSYADDDDYAPPKPKRRKPPKLTSWVRERSRRDAVLGLIGAAVLVPLGAVTLFITFWAIYGICLRLSLAFQPTHGGLLVAATIILLLLFVGNYCLDRDELERLEFEDWHGEARLLMMATGHGWASAFTGPKAATSFAKVALTIFFLGPRMWSTAWRLAKRAFALQQVDASGCGKVLGTLLAEQHRVSFEELTELYPKLDIRQIAHELSRFHGIVFLPSDPPGMALTPDLEEDLIEHIEREREARDED